MAIDHIINYDCIPKQTLTTQGILDRLKGRDRAETIIAMYRREGDERPPSEMGFEFTVSTPDEQSEKVTIVVQDLLDQAAALDPLAHHCEGCPANRAGKPFGCMGFIQYPISARGEAWLLNNLPVPDDALIWLLLKQGIEEFQYDGSLTATLRGSDVYFEIDGIAMRKLGEFSITNDQVFEMIFAVGNIMPNHAAILLLFFNGIRRDLEAQEIMQITPAPFDAETRYPFKITIDEEDDQTVTEFKQFFHALYTAWKLNVSLVVDS